MILTEKILMVEPKGFSFNNETSGDNFFQSPLPLKAHGEAAMKEFHDLKNKLVKAGIMVTVISPEEKPVTPDGVFPNNWFSTTPEKQLILYPMMAVNRRDERRKEIIVKLKKDYPALIDLTPLEEKGKFLEGTGSLCIDHKNKIAYCALSGRSDKDALSEWSKNTGYETMSFTAVDSNGGVVYHTNVVMALAGVFNIICLDAVSDKSEKEMLKEKLSYKSELIELTKEQMQAFSGNCLALKNGAGEKFIIMSTQAFNAFTEEQKHVMIRHVTIIHSPLTTIETLGGGSARCMMAELF